MDKNMQAESPIDQLLSEKTAASVAKQQKEMDHWEQWTKSRSPEHLEPLLDLYQPLIRRKAQEYGAGAVLIPPPALEAELTKHVIGAFETYDPTRGATLNTHVQTRIQKAKRYVIQHQNLAYIPENPAGKIGPIARATDQLTEDFGRIPTPQEIADHLKMPVKTVARIRGAVLRDVPGSSLMSDEADTSMHLGPREDEILSLLPGVLTEDEREVFGHIYNPNIDQRVTSTTALARKLNKNPSRVSRLKSSILKKAKDYL